MPPGIRQGFDLQEALRRHGVVQFRSRHGMRQRNLDRLAIQFLRVVDGFLNRLFGLARQADDEVAVYLDSDFAAVLHEGAAHLDRRALLNVLDDLRVAVFQAHDKEPRPAVRHRFYRFVIAMHARRRRPLKLQRFELGAKIQHAVLADVEGVVVEENLLHLWEVFERLLHFPRHVFRRARSPGMSRNRLRPHTEGAERRASARGVKRYVRMQQERHVVAFDFQVTLVDVRGERQRVQFFGVQLWAFRVVHDLSVFAVAHAQNFAQRFPVRVFHHRVVALSAGHKIDVRAGIQRLIGLYMAMWSDESDLQARVGFLDFPDKLDVAFQTNGGREEDQKFVVFTDLDGLLPIDFVRRGVQQPATRDHPRGVRQPNRVPVGFNLTCCRPTRTRTTVEILETRRIHQQCFHYIRHSSPSAFAQKWSALTPGSRGQPVKWKDRASSRTGAPHLYVYST